VHFFSSLSHSANSVDTAKVSERERERERIHFI